MSESITICMPHWQVKPLVVPCLRSVRKYSRHRDVRVMVVDNGSRDDSLEYLRSLDWIELIERPEESPDNWPRNVFTAWDLGIRRCRTDYFVTMHTDVFVKSGNWLEPFLMRMADSPEVAAVGAWKLALESPLYRWQKEVFGGWIKRLKGNKRGLPGPDGGRFPRDYCAMYRVAPIVDNDLRFATDSALGGGLPIMRQLWELGYEHRMIPIPELSRHIVHIAHGSAAVAAELSLNHKSAQIKVEKRVAALFEKPWVKQLFTETQWDQ